MKKKKLTWGLRYQCISSPVVVFMSFAAQLPHDIITPTPAPGWTGLKMQHFLSPKVCLFFFHSTTNPFYRSPHSPKWPPPQPLYLPPQHVQWTQSWPPPPRRLGLQCQWSICYDSFTYFSPLIFLVNSLHAPTSCLLLFLFPFTDFLFFHVQPYCLCIASCTVWLLMHSPAQPCTVCLLMHSLVTQYIRTR